MESVEESSESESEESEITVNELLFYNLYKLFVILKKEPLRKTELESEFISALYDIGNCIESKENIYCIIDYYKTALEFYPGNSKILNNLAAYLLKSNEPVKAIPFLEEALIADDKFLLAYRNYQNACSMAVERWHFIMLNDKSRNHAFNEAIRKKVLQGYDTILDIGTGTGLLSLYAHDARAKKIYACEQCPVMYDIAKQVLRRNDAYNVELIFSASHKLRIPIHIPERVKLIIAELFDAALLGELIIPTLIDAHQRLLETDGKGIIIPKEASVYVAAVESDYIKFRSSILFGESHHLGPLKFENVIVIHDENYYDTENLENVKVKYITEPKPILHIDFNDLNCLNTYVEDGVKSILETYCRYDGVIDGIVAWFTLNLDEEISLDSSQKTSCWQLAVFPTFPLNVKSGDNIKIFIETSKGILKCSCDLNTIILENNENRVYRFPLNVITFLNDKDYTEGLMEQAKVKKNENITTVIDTSPFPIYGLTLLKKNINCKTLFYMTENKDLQDLIQYILIQNNINGKVQFISDPSEVHDPVDDIYIHSFDTKGELLDWGELSYKQAFSYYIKTDATILPNKIDLYGQLCYSKELANIVSVKDYNLQRSTALSNTEDSKYIVAKYINKFKINQVFDLNSSLYNNIPLSKPMYLTTMDGSLRRETTINFVTDKEKNIIPNALICWYKIFLNDDGYETKRDNSFMNHVAVVFEDEDQDKLKSVDIKIKIEQMYDMFRIRIL